MRSFKFLLFALPLLILWVGNTFAAPYQEVSCSNLPSNDSCSQCFNAWGIYEWWSRLGIYDEFVNSSDNTYLYYDKENEYPYTWKKLQSTTNWDMSRPLFNYVNNSRRSAFWYTSKAGDLYHIFDPKFTDKYLQADSDRGIQLRSVAPGTNKDAPAFLLRVHTNYRQFLGAGKVWDLRKHTECFYFYANWCWDGVLQADKWEKCDPNDPNKVGWGNAGCNASCQPINNEPPVCKSDYNGKTLDNLTGGNHLCEKGTFSDFNFTNNTWTWKCNGQAGTTPVDCSATKNDKVYDLALTKVISPETPAPYQTGSTVKFSITVINQGNYIAKNIEVTDYLPDGLELDDAGWTNAGAGKVVKTLTQEIAPGQSVAITLQTKISANFTGNKIRNLAEISKDNSADYNTTDKDSTPDSNVNNDCFREGHLVTGNGKLAQAQGCSDSTDEDDHDGVKILLTTPKNPNIKKELTGPAGHRYAVGELVGFKMPFKNPHNVQINNVSVRDYLPQNLEYVSSEIHGVTPYVSGQFMSGAVQVVEYSGFNLAPLQEGYLLLTGKVKADYLDQRINLVQILVNKIVVDHDTKWYPLKDRGLTIEKVVDKRVLATGEVATFTIKVSVTTGSYTGLTVVDTLPAGLVYDNAWQLTGSRPNMETISFATGKNSQNLDTLTWKFKFPDTIKTGESFQIEMKTKLTESSKTVYTNKACVENPDGNPPEYCDPEDVVPKRPGGDLRIKKYVNKVLADAGREDVEMTGFAQWQTGYFTLEVRDARVGLTGFVVSDVIEWNLQYLDSKDLANNAFTGEFIRATANIGAYTYTVNVDVQNLSGNKTKLEWKVTMTSGQFLPGDVYKIKFKGKWWSEKYRCCKICDSGSSKWKRWRWCNS